jgi:hypothetical protein
MRQHKTQFFYPLWFWTNSLLLSAVKQTPWSGKFFEQLSVTDRIKKENSPHFIKILRFVTVPFTGYHSEQIESTSEPTYIILIVILFLYPCLILKMTLERIRIQQYAFTLFPCVLHFLPNSNYLTQKP